MFTGSFRWFREWIAVQLEPTEVRVEWRALARTFLKLGTTGFGGGIAVISQIRRLVVHQKKWMTEETMAEYMHESKRVLVKKGILKEEHKFEILSILSLLSINSKISFSIIFFGVLIYSFNVFTKKKIL